MAYGKRTVYGNRSNNPLNTYKPKKYKKTYRKKKASVKKNAYSVASLQRQVNKIRLQSYGKPQKARHIAVAQPGFSFSPYKERPILINLSNLRARTSPTNTGCNVFQNDASGVLQNIGVFENYVNGFWNSANGDVPDSGSVYWRGTNFKAEITSGRALLTDCYINFTTFKFKNAASQLIDPTTGQGLVLPTAIGQLADMCGNNTFNKSYFKVFHNKTVYLNSRTATAAAPADIQRNTTGNVKYCTMSMEPKRILRQAVTSTVAGDEQNISSIKGWQTVNVTIDQPLWLLISTNLPEVDAAGDPNDEKIFLEFVRTNYWRDMIGSGIA